MTMQNVEIPYGAYWSTPFTKWQGSLQYLHSMKFAAHVAKQELAKRSIDPTVLRLRRIGYDHQPVSIIQWCALAAI